MRRAIVGTIVRGTRVSSDTDEASIPDDCLGRCLRVRRTIAGSRLFGHCVDRTACVQSATEISRCPHAQSYSFFRVRIAAGLAYPMDLMTGVSFFAG